mmetsp:Transcript_21124/g.31603  ORF Transcript_21124/g.31603 Transcript_21124/m.31603 type:complete len:92 (-) Transcript_21124:35-310(-)
MESPKNVKIRGLREFALPDSRWSRESRASKDKKWHASSILLMGSGSNWEQLRQPEGLPSCWRCPSTSRQAPRGKAMQNLYRCGLAIAKCLL